jgi:hypothetical protein
MRRLAEVEVNMFLWIRFQFVVTLGIDGLVTSYLEAVMAKSGPMLFPYLGEDGL